MKKLGITTLPTATFLAAAMFMLLPAQEAMAAKVGVLSVTKTLPANGSDVTCTFTAKRDSIIYEILVDNHPTLDEGLCTVTGTGDGDTVICENSDLRVVSIKIDGRDYRPGQLPAGFPGNDGLAVRTFIASQASDAEIALQKDQELEITFDTENGVNDVVIEVTFGYIGGKATLE